MPFSPESCIVVFYQPKKKKKIHVLTLPLLLIIELFFMEKKVYCLFIYIRNVHMTTTNDITINGNWRTIIQKKKKFLLNKNVCDDKQLSLMLLCEKKIWMMNIWWCTKNSLNFVFCNFVWVLLKIYKFKKIRQQCC